MDATIWSLECISIYRLVMSSLWTDNRLSGARQRESKKKETSTATREESRCQTTALVKLDHVRQVGVRHLLYHDNKLNWFCTPDHYIICNPQGLCDNLLVAWLDWCKALLAEFLCRYVFWQHNILREQWGCWITMMQTDRVSWNMKPGRSTLSEKKIKMECAC